jgi:hypothetical protein
VLTVSGTRADFLWTLLLERGLSILPRDLRSRRGDTDTRSSGVQAHGRGRAAGDRHQLRDPVLPTGAKDRREYPRTVSGLTLKTKMPRHWAYRWLIRHPARGIPVSTFLLSFVSPLRVARIFGALPHDLARLCPGGSNMATTEISRATVRCPYCVEGNGFRPMVEISDNRHVCKTCGHIVSLSESSFVCGCVKCLQLSGELSTL